MLRRYHNADLKEMPLNEGISLLAYAFEKEEDDKLYARWVGFAQYEVSFEEFKQKLMPVRVDEKETLKEIDELMSKTSWRKEPIRSE